MRILALSLVFFAASLSVFASIPDNSVTTAKIANNAITLPKMTPRPFSSASPVPAGTRGISPSSGSFTTTSGTPVLVTNLVVTLTTLGGPVMILLIPDGTSNSSYIGCIYASASCSATIYLYRSGSAISKVEFFGISGAGNAAEIHIAPGAVSYIDTPSAGAYTYSVYVNSDGFGTDSISHVQLVAYEL